MSIFGRRVSHRAVVGAVAVLLVLALLPVMSKSPSREVTLVVRGMAFYVDGQFDAPNPTIRAPAGETVRVVLRNEDRGITHDFAIPALGEAIEPIQWNERAAITFDLPSTPGEYDYVCQPHQVMMKGKILVE